MKDHIEPFALQLFRKFQNGESVEALSSCLGIPEQRVRQRLRVASLLYARHTAVRPRILAIAPPDDLFTF